MNHNCPKNISIIRKGKIIEGCELDIHLIQGTETSAKNTRDKMRRDYQKDLLQPSDKEFAKAYGAQAARDAGWSESTLRKYG